MAYMGRGGFSSFSRQGDSRMETSDNNARRYYRGGLFRFHFFIPLDNTYVIFQIIVSIIILTVTVITFLVTYKPSVIDPIENTKKIIINTYLIINVLLLALVVFANFFSKTKKSLGRRITVLLLISILTIIVFCAIKSNMDSNYTKNKFEQIYTEKYSKEISDDKTKFNVGLTGIQIKTEKENFVDECAKAYNIFGIRMYGILALNILLIFLLIYQRYKVAKIQENIDKLYKNDAVLFDDEENIKI